jgi:hypothetical protein
MTASLRRILFVVFAVGLLTWNCSPKEETAEPMPTATPPIAPLDLDEERPPIIISDGSVDVYIDYGKDGRGQWMQVNQNQDDKWYHDYPNAPIGHFGVTLVNVSKQAKADCDYQNPDHVFTVTTFTITFNRGNADFLIDGQGNPQVNFSDKGKRDPALLFWLATMDNGLNLKSITFPEIQGGLSCDFAGGHRSIIRAAQMK